MLKSCNLWCVPVAATLLMLGMSTANSAERTPNQLLSNSVVSHVSNVSLTKNSNASQPAEAKPCKTYKPCSISYCGCCDCCGPKAGRILLVKDPCDCCCELAEIPVCLPACCKNPCIDSRCGIFGRSVVTYTYDCGCCVTVVFRRCGDVVVKYGG